MHPRSDSDLKSPMLSPKSNQNRDTSNKVFSEESKENIDLPPFVEEGSNIAFQEQFFFDTGDRRIVPVKVVLQSKALYIILDAEGETSECIKFSRIIIFEKKEKIGTSIPKIWLELQCSSPKEKSNFLHKKLSKSMICDCTTIQKSRNRVRRNAFESFQ